MYDFYPHTHAKKMISIGFAAILVLMLVLGAVSIVQLGAMRNELDKVVAKTNAKIASAYVMRDVIRQRSILLRNTRLSSDPFERDAYSQQFYNIAGIYREAREKLVSLGMDEKEWNIHRELSEIATNSQPYNDRAMEYILGGADESSINLEFANAKAMQNRLLDLLGELILLEENYAETARAESHKNFSKTLYLLIALIGLILLIGVLIAVYIVHLSNRVTRYFQYQASHDSLTGLVNRREFEIRVAMAIHSGRAEHSVHALLYLDLDEFKKVNDSSGHAAGDQLLKSLSSVLLSVVRKGDTVARLGGDEFGVLLFDCNPEHAFTIANDLRQAVANHQFNWGSEVYRVGASIGIVAIDRNTRDVSEVLRLADIACYKAKQKGKNNVSVFAPADADVQPGDVQQELI